MTTVKREMPPADADRVSTEIEDGGGDPIYTIDDFLRDCAVTLGVPAEGRRRRILHSRSARHTKTREYRAAEELRRMQDVTCLKRSAPGGGIQTIYYCDAKGGRIPTS
ncbi:hypothetical protein P7H12_00030 [Paenibacillus larvae]|nr:hypothetical protein [Paenibacillus larvae]MDT2262360.1 hypothetical protein [Paenibacillus larvae]